MKDSYLFVILAMVAIAPHMSKGFGMVTWAINMTFFAVLFNMGK